jgi:ketopantoate hydroxymethyltransferase
MTQNEYKQISKALENMTEHIIKSLDKYTSDVKELVNPTKDDKKRS